LSVLTVSVCDSERRLRHNGFTEAALDSNRPHAEHVLSSSRQAGHLVRLHLGRQLLDRHPRVLIDVSTLDEEASEVFAGGCGRGLPLEGHRAASSAPERQLGWRRRRFCTARPTRYSSQGRNKLIFTIFSRRKFKIKIFKI